jgi:hypothetical protein
LPGSTSLQPGLENSAKHSQASKLHEAEEKQAELQTELSTAPQTNLEYEDLIDLGYEDLIDLGYEDFIDLGYEDLIDLGYEDLIDLGTESQDYTRYSLHTATLTQPSLDVGNLIDVEFEQISTVYNI